MPTMHNRNQAPAYLEGTLLSMVMLSLLANTG